MAPRPPPPMTPAIAEYPRTVATFIAPPKRSEGVASGRMKCMIVYIGDAPMAVAASIIPGDTSQRDDSTIRATMGIVPTVRGTMDATVPMEEPVTNLVKGINKTSNIRKGNDLKIFTIVPKITLTGLFSKSLPLEVAYRTIPNGRPMM